MNNRVVVTGGGMVSALGTNWEEVKSKLQSNVSAVKTMDNFKELKNMYSHLAAPVECQFPDIFTVKNTRTMGRVSKLSVYATELALIDSGLKNSPSLKNGSTGVAYGSSSGSTDAATDFIKMIIDKDIDGINATTYPRMMSHTAAVNIALFYNTQGRIIPTSCACTSSSQAIGYAFETIKLGKQDVMIAGGAEELCPSINAVFDVLYATSIKNDDPLHTPRPFDEKRDGLVVGEGAGTLILESYDHATKRKANILAEVVGFGTNSDGRHITLPEAKTMAQAIYLALEDANISNAAIGYVNTHSTGTLHGDIAESHATHKVFGKNIPISSIKGNIGHTLGACGAIEALASIYMMQDNYFMHTLNLENIDPKCANLDYIVNEFRPIDCQYVMSNNFAFGGINTSLIFKKYDL